VNDFLVETWDQAYKVCLPGTKIDSQSGPDSSERLESGPTLTGYLTDYRGSNPNTNLHHDVRTLIRKNTWNTTLEWYWFGQWFNPDTQRWESLGLVRWQVYDAQGHLTNQADHAQLVDCDTVAVCYSCPP
jgi:hypothetical protein